MNLFKRFDTQEEVNKIKEQAPAIPATPASQDLIVAEVAEVADGSVKKSWGAALNLEYAEFQAVEMLKEKYNRLLRRFSDIEARVERSKDKQATFKELHGEWCSLVESLSSILNEVPHTQEEALNGFRPFLIERDGAL